MTRQPEQSVGLSEALTREGATVVEVPLIETAPPEDLQPLRDALARLAEYDWIVFTSANGVRAVLANRLGERALPEGVQVAAVGPATARALAEELPRATVSLVPAADARAEGLVAAFAGVDLRRRRVLLPQSAIARDTVAAGLAGMGALVDVVTAYRTVIPADAKDRLAATAEGGVDVVTLASPSAVKGFVDAWPGGTACPPAVTIGPVTEKAAREAGLRVVGTARDPGPQGIVEVLVGLTRPL